VNDSALHPDGLPKPARAQRRDGSKGRRDVAEKPAGPPQPGALKDLDPWREALGAPRIRVAVEASDPITASGLSTHLSRHPNIDFVSGADDAATVEVHVLCVDRVDAEVIRQMRTRFAGADTRTVLVTRDLRHEDALSLVECGVVAVLPRHHATPEQVARMVLGARSGRGAFPSDLVGSLLEQVAELHKLALSVGLTPSGLAKRERDVLRLVADGYNTAEIAERLSYSERTVKNILYDVLSRLKVRNRSHAVAAAIRAGVI